MKTLCTLIALLLLPGYGMAGVCDNAWDGDKFVESFRGSSPSRSIRLRGKDAIAAEVTVGQVQAFYDAKEKISRLAGLSPSFVICGDGNVNAFAGTGGRGQVVGVTVGMLKVVNGNADMAAAVIGHEYAHHLKGHGAAAQSREVVLGLLGLVAGMALEQKIQQRYGVAGVGLDLGQIGSTLVSRKFDRDQEREADQVGFEYMVRAGFNPMGAVQLANRLNQLGLGGVGLFFESHPGWGERENDFRTMIARSAEAQRLVSTSRADPPPGRPEPSQSGEPIALAPTYTISDAQRSFSAGLVAYRSGDIVNAVREWRSAAGAGYAPAQAAVGYLFSQGKGGLPKDEVEAVRLFRLAADQGNATAQAYLGFAHVTGQGGLPKNDVEAVRLFRLAADQGNAIARANLGFAYATGQGGLPKDEAEAVRLYRLAADQGNALGQSNLGGAYALGLGGLPKDEMEAVRLFRLAAHQGNPRAQANLGLAYVRGQGGLPKDEMEAARLFRLAADQGNVTAQNGLGVMSERGIGGLPRDIEAAVAWYRLAAKQGMPQAVASLRRLGRE
jgi:TPR repeat protein/Zn-dependent protease with chaperone function